MKIILIKDCKDGKANTIIEVSNGYGMNYLVAKGFGVPYNKETQKQLDKNLSDLTNQEMQKRSEALALKDEIEKVVLKYTLDAHIDNNGNLIAHNAISTKDILKELKARNFDLDKYAVQKVKIVSNGLKEVEVIVYKDIKAKLRVEVALNVK